MIATFILFLREGIEACLIVSILFAALRQLDQAKQARAIWMGVVLALLGSLAGGLAIYFTVHEYSDTRFQTIFETATYITAVILLTTMTFWMQQHSRTMKKEIIAKASTASSGFALGLLAFTSVGREGLESAFFTVAFAFQTNALMLLLGALLGLLVAIGLCVLIYRLGYRLDYRLFFRVMGILLIFFAAGLLGNAIQNLQTLGWLTIGTTPLWNISHILSQESVIGDLLHGMVGYSDAPSRLQGLFYVAYLLVAGGIFTWMTRKPSGGQPVRSDAAAANTVAGQA
ncbi:MAG TPA: FTR1 family protein [Ktedonobacteraceae bacterium]|nr:FTR1 family protein [Ktedonobacteraceae bacterium]